MTPLQTGTKVLIEATVTGNTDPAHPHTIQLKPKSGHFIYAQPSDLTVCETAQPWQPKNGEMIRCKKPIKMETGEIRTTVGKLYEWNNEVITNDANLPHSGIEGDFLQEHFEPIDMKKIDKANWKVQRSDPDFIKVWKAAQFKSVLDNSIKWIHFNNGQLFFTALDLDSDNQITGQQALKLLGVETQPIDLNNFCIDITDPVNAELLPGFKEWFLKNYNIQNSHHYQYYEVCNGLKSRTNHYDPPHYLTTLPDLQKQHPGVFFNTNDVIGDDFSREDNNDSLVTNGNFSGSKNGWATGNGWAYTPSFKAGQEVEWTNHSIWHKGHYVGKTRDGKYVVEICDTVHSCVIVGENAIRPIPAQPTVESELRQLYEKAKAIDRYETWKSLATAWHQKNSGRVEVSVPSDDKIEYRYEYYSERNGGNVLDAVIKTVRHFMTRKEAK